MTAPRPMRSELFAVAALAMPIALAQLGNNLLGTVDTAVVGRAGEIPLAAVGLGNSIFFSIVVLGLGVMLGLDPMIGQALGAGDELRARRYLSQGVWLAAGVSIPIALLSVAAVLLLGDAGIGEQTARETVDYVYSRLPGIFPFYVFIGTRSYLQAHGRTMPILIAVVVANVVNLPLSWVLVHGDEALAIPAFGVAGAGLTSSVCAVLEAVITFSAVRKVGAAAPAGSYRPDRAILNRTLGYGLPIGLTLLAEVASFGLVAYLAGLFGARALAAHNVAITLASTTFQVPLAIGAAAAVRVARGIGARDPEAARRGGQASLSLGGAFMLLTSLMFLLLPDAFARIITDDPAIRQAAVPLLRVAAAFQLVDGLQAVGAGALRGAGDTRYALVANAVGHYGLGLPFGAVLAWSAGLGVEGLWWGLSVGLTTVAVALVLRFRALPLSS